MSEEDVSLPSVEEVGLTFANPEPGTQPEGKPHLFRGNLLLVNGYNPPIPRKLLNQRQKRKLKRQCH